MSVLLVRHKVKDYATWKSDFDAQGETRRANGSHGGRIFRNASDPNETFILFEWDGLDRARLFAQSDDLRGDGTGWSDRPTELVVPRRDRSAARLSSGRPVPGARRSIMDATRFDRVAKIFAERRISRRTALAQAGTGLAVGALAAAGFKEAAAQDAPATPAAAGDGEKTSYLFVQSFQSGSIAAKAGEAGTYTVTLEQGLGQTIYFADRPSRDVGAVPTPRFLDGLGFPPDNPPNAALVLEAAPGVTDVAVVELFNPRYDEATHTATYDVQVLGEWEQSLELGFSAVPTDLAALAPTFGPAHLFIDDCSDQSVLCCTGYLTERGFECAAQHGSFGPMGFCWHFGDFCCHPCESDSETHWADKCNATYSGCQGACQGVATGCW